MQSCFVLALWICEESSSILVITNYSKKDVNHRNENMINCCIFRKVAALRFGFLPTQDKSLGSTLLQDNAASATQLPNIPSNPWVSRERVLVFLKPLQFPAIKLWSDTLVTANDPDTNPQSGCQLVSGHFPAMTWRDVIITTGQTSSALLCSALREGNISTWGRTEQSKKANDVPAC